MIIACTAHRPNKLGNEYNYDGPYSQYIGDQFDQIILKYKPEKIISGMALGGDTLWAISGLYLGIPLITAIPFEGQEKAWPQASQDIYNKILNHKLTEKVYVCDPGYEVWKMQKRNEWMVDHCDILVAVWDGTPGGTANCVEYARKKGCYIIYIDPRKSIEK